MAARLGETPRPTVCGGRRVPCAERVGRTVPGELRQVGRARAL